MDYFALERVLQLCHLTVVTTLDLSAREKKQVSTIREGVTHHIYFSKQKTLDAAILSEFTT